jgi:hypothetical protein
MSNLRDVITYESSVVNAMCNAEHQLPCVLHLHKRVIEKVMTMIYCVSLDEVSTTNNNARKGQIVKIAHIINTIAYGTPTDPGTYRVPYDPKTGLIGEVKFDVSRAKVRGGIERNPSTAHHTITQQNCMVLLHFTNIDNHQDSVKET